MEQLIKFFKKVKKTRKYSYRDKLLILKAFFITGAMRMALIVVPFNILRKYLGQYNEESTFSIEKMNINRIQKISWAIAKISLNTPWDCKCFVQALTAQKLLWNEGFESTLYLGVSKSSKNGIPDAHAWIRCGNIYVTGGNGDEFTITVKFKK